ncbi:maestro heat-like repeat family member 5 [Elgaria multicarinata webbii]|uniref:maestro heat-like repeat family member 5 n=1 Tax=Elgaria multicarinata webbii TaxID=159646 RepID=UPI002FCD0BB7
MVMCLEAELLEEDSSIAGAWRRNLKRLGARSLLYHQEKELCEILHQVFREEGKTSRDSALPKLFLYQYYGAILHASKDHALVEESLDNLLQLLLTEPSDKEGILSAIGLIASRHMESAFNVLKKYASEEVLSYNIQEELLILLGKISSTERCGSLIFVRPSKDLNEDHQADEDRQE